MPSWLTPARALVALIDPAASVDVSIQHSLLDQQLRVC